MSLGAHFRRPSAVLWKTGGSRHASACFLSPPEKIKIFSKSLLRHVEGYVFIPHGTRLISDFWTKTDSMNCASDLSPSTVRSSFPRNF
jgi:hypothetical protein